MIIQQQIHINKCLCGWQFLALDRAIKKCSQCKDDQRLCIDCGCSITGHHHKKFCDVCLKNNRSILQKYNMRARRKNEKYEHSDRNNIDNICNYDCFNCKFSECLLPVDKEDLETGNLFRG